MSRLHARSVPTFLLATALFVVALPAELGAQQRELPPKRPLPAADQVGRPAPDLPADRGRPAADPGSLTPLMVRGSAGEVEERPADDVPEPPDLTPQQHSQLLGSLGLSLWEHGGGPWKLTPATPVVAGRAALGFREAEYVSVGSAENPGSARIHGRQSYGPMGNVSLRVTASAPGDRYLIDCKVSPTSSGLRFSGPGSSATFTTAHLTAIYEATDTAPANFTIDVPFNSNTYSFTFYSCEITQLE